LSRKLVVEVLMFRRLCAAETASDQAIGRPGPEATTQK
jgi:hypothetical protein